MLSVDVLKSNISKENVIFILKKYGVTKIVQSDNTLRCACPIHKGKNESAFMWKLDNNNWCCFKEKIGGDIFNFIAYMEQLDLEKDFIKIINIIANEFNINIDNLEIGEIDLKQRKDTNEWLNYVLHKKENNKDFNINTLGKLVNIKKYRMLEEDMLKEYEIVYSKDLNRICFPIRDENNNLIGASCRANGNMKPKWLHFPKGLYTGIILYNLKFCIDNGFKEIYIVEGIIDVLNLARLGIFNVVCVFGSKITDEQGILLMKYFDSIILAFDNDEAGHIGISKAIKKYNNIFILKVLCLIDINDVGQIENIEEFNKIEIKEWWKYEL